MITNIGFNQSTFQSHNMYLKLGQTFFKWQLCAFSQF